MEKINFEDGQLTKRGCVTIDGKEYPITEPEYDGATPLSAYVLNKLQDNIEEGINNIQALPIGGTKGQVLTKQSKTDGDANWEDIEANEVFVGKAEEAPETAKIIVEEEDFKESSTLSKSEVYIGPDEPSCGEKVWFRKDENLFNKNKSIVNGYYISDTGTLVSATNSWYQDIYIDVLPNTQYRASTTNNVLRVVFYDANKKFISRITTENNEIRFIVPSNCSYVKLSGNNSNYNNLQIKQSLETIFIKNSNDIYEEFIKKQEEVYSANEQAIGTWIDGKTLYRKVVNLGNLPNASAKSVSTGLSNVNYVKSYGMMTNGSIYFEMNNTRPTDNTTNNETGLYISNNTIYIETKIDRSSYTGFVVLEYTKTN